MTVQRVVFHYGIELEGLKYNGPELGELRRRMGAGAKVELTFDPGDLGHVNVLDPQKGTYICVPAVIRPTPRDSPSGRTRSSADTHNGSWMPAPTW